MTSLYSLVAFLLLPFLISAQTYTTCNPLDATCSPDPALGTSTFIDFSSGASDQFDVVSAGDKISYSSDGADFTISAQGDNPTIQSNFYIMFGKVEVVLRAAPGVGIVSSFVLQSDDLDEIDLEWLGGDITQFQSNFFSKGDTSTYDRGAFHPVDSPQTEFHNYTIDWSEDQTVWYLDGVVVRVLPSTTASGYPQTPMAVRIGSWAGGDSSNPIGTIEWAGGYTDYTQGPFVFSVKSLYVQDYSTGSEYQYGDNSGSWSSIQAVGGEVNGNVDGSADGAVVVTPSTSISLAISSVVSIPGQSSAAAFIAQSSASSASSASSVSSVPSVIVSSSQLSTESSIASSTPVTSSAKPSSESSFTSSSPVSSSAPSSSKKESSTSSSVKSSTHVVSTSTSPSPKPTTSKSPSTKSTSHIVTSKHSTTPKSSAAHTTLTSVHHANTSTQAAVTSTLTQVNSGSKITIPLAAALIALLTLI